jgi:hypothetical protein
LPATITAIVVLLNIARITILFTVPSSLRKPAAVFLFFHARLI